jgi:hypothetical protein
MFGTRKSRRNGKQAKTLSESMRYVLTPSDWKQVRKVASRRKKPRWDVHPLIYVVLVMTWCSGDSLPEKWEAARGFYVVCCPARRRPGRTFSGFQMALGRLPMPVLRAVADCLRKHVINLFGADLLVEGFIPLGCDGTRQECPRTEELERRLGTFGKVGSPPMIWNTSLVHLTLGIPWAWRLGRGGKASERHHLV